VQGRAAWADWPGRTRRESGIGRGKQGAIVAIYRVFTGTKSNGDTSTMIISVETLAEELEPGQKSAPADFFAGDVTDIMDRGTFEPVGAGADWLPDWFEAKD